MKRTAFASLLAAAAFAAPACATEGDVYDEEGVKSEDGKADSSALAVFLDFEFENRVLVDFSVDDEKTVEDHLLYTVGLLNGSSSVGRVDKARISNITKRTVGSKIEIKYKAILPVAWGKRASIPNTYELKLPLDISQEGQQAFATKYSHDCVDFGAHDVDAGSMFYYYRPKAPGCTLDAADITVATATVSPSATATTGKFPEINKVWEDGQLNVLAIFGKYEDGATTSSDAGIAAYNEFITLMKRELQGATITTIPATVPSSPGVAMPDIEITATLPDGKKVKVVALLTDNVNVGLSQPAFRARYESLTPKADYITYNGHAGLGTNVRALANAGRWVAGQYVVVFMNGCDTFAYVDDALFTAHKRVNADDTTIGTKYIDIVNNAMPSFFVDMADSTIALYRGLMAYNAPVTYEAMFRNVSSSQIILVSGEEDNKFVPGGGGTPTAWAGLNETSTVTKNTWKKFSTPTLAAGKYKFDMLPNGGTGDADLYVRIGSEPTTAAYDCRPYKEGTTESCTVDLAAPAKIYVNVRGYSTGSTKFKLAGKKL